MNNKEVIIEKIISDAQSIVDDILSKAQQEVKSIESKTNDTIEALRAVEIPKGEKQAQEILQRKEMVTALDCKKLVLSKKTKIIDEVFLSIADDMRKNNKKGYISLIENMIKKVCDDNDKVIISKYDKDIITKSVIEKIAKESGKKISLSNDMGDFCGGVILSGEKFDKNLTLEVEFEEIKQQHELEITKILFGE